MFKVGDRVKCIKVGRLNGSQGTPPPLVLNREYIVYGISQCNCGMLALDVGIATTNGLPTNGCCGSYLPGNHVRWCNSKRFVKVQEKKEYIAVESNVEIENPVLS